VRLSVSLLMCALPSFAGDLTLVDASRFARLALSCVHREYPNKIAHSLASDADVKSPRQLTPAFYGCYDWHSSVHGHWMLARVARTFPDSAVAVEAKAALAASLTAPNLEQEALYLSSEGRNSFERPYGLAWLLQLASEVHEWDDDQARSWVRNLAPLERVVVARISEWLPKLTKPVRSGEHSNTAFGLGLALDYARITRNVDFQRLLEKRTRDFYLDDRSCPLSYEPSGEDFLSPCLAEADLMGKVLSGSDFAAWFETFLPDLARSPNSLTVGQVLDKTDGKLVHMDGLNLSRAWMLKSIARRFPANDARRMSLSRLASLHQTAGLAAVTGEHYEGGHWLGSFAVYLLTARDE
jgi:hypothetical protein